MIDRDQDGKLTIDGKTSLLIAGMPPGPLSEKMAAFEQLYDKWLGVERAEWSGQVARVSWFTGWRSWLVRHFPPAQIFRSEIYELVAEATRLIQAERAGQARDDFYANYTELVERERELRRFLYTHFPNQLAIGEARNLPVYEIAKEIMIGRKTEFSQEG